MAETGPISEMAEKVSSEIFSVFNWQRVGAINQNWQCVNKESHETKTGTHPSDVVLTYQDPSSDDQIYFNIDLKSFGKTSISRGSLAIALTNLAKATACANASEDWIERYCARAENRRTHGMLFIYNHDNEYAGDFDALLEQVEFDRVPLARNHRIYVFSPKIILTLTAISSDIVRTFVQREHMFYYPDMIFTKARDHWLKTASVECLLSPWLVVKGTFKGQEQRNVYYTGSGKSCDEFKFLIDFLFRYQLVDEIPISLRLPGASPEAYRHFNNAKREYAADFYSLKEFNDRLETIQYYPMTNAFKIFSPEVIGMEVR